VKPTRELYARTCAGSSARRLLADITAFIIFRSLHGNYVAKLDAEIDGEYMKDVIAALVKYGPRKEDVRSWFSKPGRYHVGTERTD
jgi:hypothetical protein